MPTGGTVISDADESSEFPGRRSSLVTRTGQPQLHSHRWNCLTHFSQICSQETRGPSDQGTHQVLSSSEFQQPEMLEHVMRLHRLTQHPRNHATRQPTTPRLWYQGQKSKGPVLTPTTLATVPTTAHPSSSKDGAAGRHTHTQQVQVCTTPSQR